MCTISNHGLPGWIFCSRRFSRPRHDFSSHDASILSSRHSLISSLVALIASLIVPPLLLRCLSHCSGWLLYPCLSRCAADSLVVPPLSSRLYCHAASSLVTPPIIYDAACRYQCQIPPRHCQRCGQAACTCMCANAPASLRADHSSGDIMSVSFL